MARRKKDEELDLKSPGGRLRWARLKRSYETATDAAKGMGATTSTYTHHENGTRPLTRQAAERYAKFFQVRPEWLLWGDGVPSEGEFDVPVLGYVGAGAEITPVDDHAMGAGLDAVERPPGLRAGAVAAAVRGQSQYPAYRDGDVIVWDEDPSRPEDVLGEECVVKLSDGRMFVKVLARGSRPGFFTLLSYNAEPILDQEVEWAAPIRWIARRR